MRGARCGTSITQPGTQTRRMSVTIHSLALPRIPRMATLAVAATLFIALAMTAPAAHAAVSCTKQGTTVRVTLGAGDAAGIARSGDAIHVNGSACGTATVNNIDRIAVTGSTGNEKVTIDLSGGQFAPGATSEPTGT